MIGPAMLNRRRFLQAVSAGLLAGPVVAAGQPARKVVRLGRLSLSEVDARPGRASTDAIFEGLVTLGPGGGDFGGKFLQLLTEVAPRLSRVGFLRSANNSSTAPSAFFPAPSLTGIRLVTVEIRDPGGLDQAFDALIRARVQALISDGDPLTDAQFGRIVEFAMKRVRAGCQRQDRQGPGPHHPAGASASRRPDHRMTPDVACLASLLPCEL